MKKTIYILIFALVLGACDDGFDELNVNPTKPTQVDVRNKMTAVQLFTSGERYENWRAMLIYSSTMIQHFATTAGYWSGDKYSWNQGYASSMIDRIYGNAVKNVQDMIVQLEDGGGTPEMMAVTRIQRVLIFHRLTDLYGDVPYSEAGKAYIDGITTPVYDAQAAIYADMLKELEESVAVLSSGDSGFGSADLFYGGDQAQWKRFGNSLMLRLALRMIKVDAAGAKAWAEKAIAGGVMESNDDIAWIQHTNGPDGINRNGMGEVFTVDASMRISETFRTVLEGDPRLPILAQRRKDGSTVPADLLGLKNGLDGPMVEEMYGYENLDEFAEPNRNIITGEDAPMFFQTYAEVEFMLAEANLRWGSPGTMDAAIHYANGVEAAMKQLAIYGDAAIIDQDDIDAYLAANPYDASKGFEMISTQYWVCTFFNEYESYANWRRVELPLLVPTNYPGNVTNGTIPRRLTYSTSEQSNNTENYNAAIARQGADVLTTRVWWDVPGIVNP